ncbi:MAG: hypothetical protein AAFU64_20940 [Bacteroidota bacterium]
MLKKIKKIFKSNKGGMDAYLQLHIHREIDRIRQMPRYKDPLNLLPYGAKVYSQNDEDGMIQEIFRRIGTKNKAFVEFGIGNGLENNTLALLFSGWRGLWIDASNKNIQRIRENFRPLLEGGQLRVEEAFINKDNIDGLIAKHMNETEIDFLSVDIDGNDYYVFEAIQCLKARVIAFEYNAKFIPPIEYCMDYNPEHVWSGDDCFGASLPFLERKLGEKGYALVGCNVTGTNAFFVQKELAEGKFQAPFTAVYPAR